MKHATQWKNMKIYIMYVPFKFELEIVKKKDILFYNSMQYFKIILCYLYYSS